MKAFFASILAFFARLAAGIPVERLNGVCQAATVLCGAYLAYAATLIPPVAAWALLLVGLLNLVASSLSKRLLVVTSGPVRVGDLIVWIVASLVQFTPGVMQELHFAVGRSLGMFFAMAGTALALFSHGPASAAAKGTGGAS